MALVLLFYKHSSPQNSEWMNEISKNGIDSALTRFCRQIPVSRARAQAAVTAKTVGHVHTALYRHTLYIHIHNTPWKVKVRLICQLAFPRWHLQSSCAPPSGFADSALRTYQECFCARKWLSRVEMFWRAPGPWPGRVPLIICLLASPKSTSRWCRTRSRYAKYVLYPHLSLLISTRFTHTFCSPVTKIITTSLCRCDRIFLNSVTSQIVERISG